LAGFWRSARGVEAAALAAAGREERITTFTEFESIRAAAVEISGQLRGLRAGLARGPAALPEELPHMITVLEKLPRQVGALEALVVRMLAQVESITLRAEKMERHARQTLAAQTAGPDAILTELAALRADVKAALR
jgi:hypothetical protein